MPTECALCSEEKDEGVELAMDPERPEETVWVCTDCEKRLLRAVDDEVSGG